MATHMQHGFFWEEIAWPPRLFRGKKQQQSQNKGDEFRWKKNMKIGGEKMRNASGQQGERERQ